VKTACHQIQRLTGKPYKTFDTKVKCVQMAIYEKGGKTILQPLINEKESKTIPGLFQNKILEVWLSNGENDIDQFDVAILKYKQMLQSTSTRQV
jgi:hypothetical protein